MRLGFTQTQNSFKAAQGNAELTADGNLIQLGAQNQHIKDFGASDPLPSVVVTAVAVQTGTTYRYTVASAQGSWTAGDKVAIQGITPLAYNGYWPIANVFSSTKFDIDIGSNPAAAVLTTSGTNVPLSSMANVFRPNFGGSSGLDALVQDMLTTRAPGGYMILTMNKGPSILVTNQGFPPSTSDSKIDPILGGTQAGNPGWDAFADLAYEIVARYVHNNDATHLYGCGAPLYVQWWNEMKGMFDGGANHWDYTNYVNFYNVGWNRIRGDGRSLISGAGKNPAAGTDILIGGPYVHINFYLRSDTIPNHAHSNLTDIGTVTHCDMQGPDVIDYFTAQAAGYDFVCFDGGSKCMDLFECDAAGANPKSVGGLVPTAEGITNTGMPHYAAFTSATPPVRKGNVDPTLLNRANASQQWQDVVNWIVNTVFPGNGALNGGMGVRPTKPVFISEAHCGNATDTSTAIGSGTTGNRNIHDADMGLLATDMLSKLSASANSSTMVVLYWGSEDRTGTNNGNSPGTVMFHEVDYPCLVYPTNQSGPGNTPPGPGGTVTPVGTAWGIGAGSGGTIVGDGPSGR